MKKYTLDFKKYNDRWSAITPFGLYWISKIDTKDNDYYWEISFSGITTIIGNSSDLAPAKKYAEKDYNNRIQKLD